MPYISPLNTLGVVEIGDVADKNALNLAKKKLLADIDLSPTQTILRGGKEMTKDDVLKSFDALGGISNWEFHKAIANDKILLAFLENFKLDKGDKFNDNPLYDRDDFIEFVSPYFSEAFEETLLYALDKRQPNRIDNLVYNNPFLGNSEDLNQIWMNTEQFIQKKIGIIDDLTEQVERGTKFTDTDLIPYTSKQMIECLNLLPEGEFDWTRDSYATALYNLSANTWNKGNYYRASDIVNNANLLIVSPEERNMLEERIQFFQTELTRLNSGGSSNPGNEGGYGSAIFWVIFILLQVFRHCGD